MKRNVQSIIKTGIVKAFENQLLLNNGKQILDKNGHYDSQFHNNMEDAGCIALFGANAIHFGEAKDGIQSGGGQAAGLAGAKGPDINIQCRLMQCLLVGILIAKKHSTQYVICFGRQKNWIN